jgi:hypothetical protein
MVGGLPRARRVIGCALLAVVAGVVSQAQISPKVDLAIEASNVFRGHTAIINVHVKVPDGYFVPAETHGSLKGSWLQVLPPWLTDIPTYPIPNSVPLSGSDRPVLAYSGSFVIEVPLRVRYPDPGPNDLSLRFAHQLCDSHTCTAVTMSVAKTVIDVQEPPPTQSLLAYRLDSQRVVIVTEMKDSIGNQASDLLRPVARMIPQVALIPENHAARSRFVGDFRVGAPWIIASNGAQFGAVVVQPAGIVWGCEGNEAPLALIARVNDSSFAKERAKYFLASHDAQRTRAPSLSVDLRLDDAQRQELEAMIDRQMRITVPSLFAPDPYVQNNKVQAKETDYDRRVRSGQARLIYHFEAYNLAPDDNPRLYVRAYWKVGAKAQTGITLWLRFDGQHFFVEQSDSSVSRSARYLELKEFGSDVAANPEYAGMLLNVIPSADGWAYVIMGRRGYESTGVSVWKYSPLGPQDTGLAYIFGC